MSRDCKTCNGTGYVVCPRCGGDKKIQGDTCYYCQGSGIVPCGACHGTGKINE